MQKFQPQLFIQHTPRFLPHGTGTADRASRFPDQGQWRPCCSWRRQVSIGSYTGRSIQVHGCVQERERASEVWRKRGSGCDRGGRWEITRIGVLNRETTKDVVAEIPLITDTMLLLAVTPLLAFHPHKPPSAPPLTRPPELCKQPLLHANKGPKNASGAFKCQGFPNPFLLFYVLKELLFLSFLPLFFSIFFLSALHAQANLYTRAATLAPRPQPPPPPPHVKKVV